MWMPTVTSMRSWANYNQGNRVWRNDGSGNFTDSSQALGSFNSRGVALGDVDADGDLDSVVANYGGNRVWRNDGSGSFIDSGQSLSSFYSSGVALGDVDADGDLDAVVVNYDQGNRVWRNDGSGNFTDSSQVLGSFGSFGVSLGDVDADGDLDAVVANYSYSGQSNGCGATTAAAISPTAANPWAALLAVTWHWAMWMPTATSMRSWRTFTRATGCGATRSSTSGTRRPHCPTLLADNGARHLYAPGPILGSSIDFESNVVPSVTLADADDSAGDDEDGITFGANAVGALAASVQVEVGSVPGRLDAWVDFNADGTFDSARERIFTNVSLSATTHSLTFTVPAMR